MLAFIKCPNTFTYIGLLSTSRLPVFFFPGNFVLQPKWWWFTGRFSQIWLQAKYEKKKTSFYIFGYLLELCIEIWRIFFEKIIIMAIEDLKKHKILAFLIF